MIRESKKENALLGIVWAVVLGLSIIGLISYIASAVVALLWNFVMPVLGLPQLTQLQALALFLLFRVLRYEYKTKQNIVLNASLVPVRKENQDEPRNKYPV